MTRIHNKFMKFINQHKEQVDIYDDNHPDNPLESNETDIISSIQDIKNIDKSSSMISIFSNALLLANRDNIDIFDALREVKKDAQDGIASSNSIQSYFKDVGRIYDKYDNDYDIEFTPENRDKIIQMNLKTVIHVAKRYQGLGVPLEDLISAGNLGLCIAWDKYKPKDHKLKSSILDALKDCPDNLSYNDLDELITPILSYGATREKFDKIFANKKSINKEDIIAWVDKNIKKASFNSVACMWIRAYILLALDGESRIVKKPKSEIYRDKKSKGTYTKEITVAMDSPDDADNIGLYNKLTGSSDNHIATQEAYVDFRDNLFKLLKDVPCKAKTIILKKYGIGLPRPMTLKEISKSEGLSLARISQLTQSALKRMRANASKYNIKSDEMFGDCSKFM